MNISNQLDPECSRTSKAMMGPLGKVQPLDTSMHVHLDSYYNSPVLVE